MSNTSLFTYNPGENITTFANASFVPIFLDEPIPFANDELRQQAEEICQGDANCLFDIASTGDTAVGASTKQVAVQLESESKELRKCTEEIDNTWTYKESHLTACHQKWNLLAVSFKAMVNVICSKKPFIR